MKGWIILAVGFVVALAALPATFGWWGQRSSKPPLEYYLDMKYQPRYEPQGQSAFFADGRAERPPVEGTVAFGGGTDYLGSAGAPRPNPELLQADDAFYRGKDKAGAWVKKSPVKLDAALLARGQERFNIHCAICHGKAGDGKGVTPLYGMQGVASYHQDKYRTMADGEIFNTITNGKNTMLAYGTLVKPADRWAIIAWVRVLQRSQNARIEDVPQAKRVELEREP